MASGSYVTAAENPCKRQRIQDNRATFEDINNDCLLIIMKFIGDADDLNSLAMCTRRCREVRNDISLDQTRTGTILCKSGSTVFDVVAKFGYGAHGRRSVFTGNRIRLIGLERLSDTDMSDARLERPNIYRSQMGRITSICLMSSSTSGQHHGDISEGTCNALFACFPNLREVEFHSTELLTSSAMCEIFWHCPFLSRMTLNASDIVLAGFGKSSCGKECISISLTDLCVDHCILHGGKYGENYWSSETHVGNDWMWKNCLLLERISMKNTLWRPRNSVARPLPQQMIMKFVRHASQLRWLRSDLTAENIAILKQERPEVTFVSE